MSDTNERYTKKVMHGYFQRKVKNYTNIDQKLSQHRTKNRNTTSHFVSYLDSIIDQEIPTKYLQHKRQQINDNKCRLCKSNVEDVVHIISSCPKMSARYRLPTFATRCTSKIRTKSYHNEESS